MKAKALVSTVLIAALVGGVSVGAGRAFAQERMALSKAQQIKQLEGCIAHLKQARKGVVTEPITERRYDHRIAEAKKTLAGLKSGQDVSQEEIDKVCRIPGNTPHD
jgi:hypothetical protein